MFVVQIVVICDHVEFSMFEVQYLTAMYFIVEYALWKMIVRR